MAHFLIETHSNEPVDVQVHEDGRRVRVRYGIEGWFTLATGEVVDLVDALTGALAEIERRAKA